MTSIRLKRWTVFFLLFVFAKVHGQTAYTPPMGWNSYNCFGSVIHEEEVGANADYMATHLKQFGWKYEVVDFLWSLYMVQTSDKR